MTPTQVPNFSKAQRCEIARNFIKRAKRMGAYSAASGMPTAEIVELLRCLDLVNAPADMMRVLLEESWLMFSGDLWAGGLHGAELLRIFRKAQFARPPVPDEFVAYRGTRGDLDTLAKGLSWTLRPETAAKYAVIPVRTWAAGDPIVASRTVLRKHVVFYHADFGDAEILIDGPISGLAVHGTLDEWYDAAEREDLRRAEWSRSVLAGPDSTLRRRLRRTIDYWAAQGWGPTADEIQRSWGWDSG